MGKFNVKSVLLVPGVFNQDAAMIECKAHAADVDVFRAEDVFILCTFVDNVVFSKFFAQQRFDIGIGSVDMKNLFRAVCKVAGDKRWPCFL